MGWLEAIPGEPWQCFGFSTPLTYVMTKTGGADLKRLLEKRVAGMFATEWLHQVHQNAFLFREQKNRSVGPWTCILLGFALDLILT